MRIQPVCAALSTLVAILLPLLAGCASAPGELPPVQTLHARWLWNPSAAQLEEWQIIGAQPGDLIAGPPGELVLADTAGGRVLRISTAGRLIQEIGRRGQGPGEFVAPTDLAWDRERDILWVGDKMPGVRMTRFKGQGGTYEFLDTFKSMAMMIGRPTRGIAGGYEKHFWANTFNIFQRDNPDTTRIKRIDTSDRTDLSFGPLWSLGPGVEMDPTRLNEGIIVDLGERGLAFCFMLRPEVEIWSKQGALLREKTFSNDDFQWVEPEKDESGIYGFHAYFQDAVWVPERDLLYTLGWLTDQQGLVIWGMDPEDFTVRERYHFDPRVSEDDYVPVGRLAVDSSGGEPVFYFLDTTNSGIRVLTR
jgi:hypothetical protein